eukprot:366261-Chlamydomonas_euryale.AAC.5
MVTLRVGWMPLCASSAVDAQQDGLHRSCNTGHEVMQNAFIAKSSDAVSQASSLTYLHTNIP